MPFILILGALAILVAASPGLLCTLLLDQWVDFHSKGAIITWSVVFSLIYLVYCFGSSEKPLWKYGITCGIISVGALLWNWLIGDGVADFLSKIFN